ncbi:MAG: helix-turn-helix domain-containing protein [Gemmatimonadales bacterium]|nr:helix-turn-helix domain-containing protein [Gemmatimonadales bacterium]
MRPSLSIGKAAARLGIEVDTLRRLERDGAIHAERTGGGHRRFAETELTRFARARGGHRAHAAQSAPPTQQRRVPHAVTSVSSRPNVVPRPTAVRDPVHDPRVLDFDDEPHYALPPAPTSIQGVDRGRLDAIKSSGLASIPYDVPGRWRSKVIADLERFVSPTQFPSYVSHFEASRIVSARVEEVLAPHREEQARAKAAREAEEKARWRLVALKTHATSYAIRETIDWDWSAQLEARLEVARELEAKAQAGWSERDVEKLVDEILKDWEDEDDEIESDERDDEGEEVDWDDDD